MKYTKKQRHEIYKKAYNQFITRESENNYNNICGVIDFITQYNGCYLCSIKMDVYFPELWMFNDMGINNRFWEFEDADKEETRKLVLSFCIYMTK